MASKKDEEQKKYSYRYPLAEIHDNTDYLVIDVLQYKPLGFVQGSDVFKTGQKSSKTNYNNVKPLNSIILPIPKNIQASNTAGWGDDNLNNVGAFALGTATDVMTNSSNFFSALIEAAKSAGSDLMSVIGSSDARNAFNSKIAADIVNLIPGVGEVSSEGVLARSTGQILNQNTELLFNGVKLRTFNFTFDLIPRNEPEGVEIKGLIRCLKRNMAAKKSNQLGGLFLKSPNVFKLTYKSGNQKHPFLNSFVTAALIDVNVNYTGSGTYMTYNDKQKTPVHMTLSLSFQELSPIYEEDYDDEINFPGVGY
jgi:hypothetical protein